MAQQGEEGGNSESFIAIANDFEVDGVPVEVIREEGDEGVEWDHE